MKGRNKSAKISSKAFDFPKQGTMKTILETFPVSRRTIERWCKHGDMPHTMMNGRYYFDMAEIQVWWNRRGSYEAS